MKTGIISLFIFAIYLAPLHAQPGQRFDDQGRIFMQINNDGSRSTYTYDHQGQKIVNASSKGQQIHFDKKGNSIVKTTKRVIK